MTYVSDSPNASIIQPLSRRSNEPMDRKHAARFLTLIGCPIAPKTLANMAARNNAGGGPSFTRVLKGRNWYYEADLRDWAATHSKKVR